MYEELNTHTGQSMFYATREAFMARLVALKIHNPHLVADAVDNGQEVDSDHQTFRLNGTAARLVRRAA